MNRVEVELSEDMHEKACAAAKQHRISVQELIATALAERLAGMEQLAYLQAHARRGSRARYRQILAKVPAVPPMAGDELPAGFKLPGKARARKSRQGK